MKRLLLVVLLAGCAEESSPDATYQAGMEEFCRNIEKHSAAIMTARQSGMSIDVAMQNAYDSEDFIRDLTVSAVRDAYSWPLMDDAEARKRAIERFSGEAYRSCLNTNR